MEGLLIILSGIEVIFFNLFCLLELAVGAPDRSNPESNVTFKQTKSVHYCTLSFYVKLLTSPHYELAYNESFLVIARSVATRQSRHKRW